MSLNGIYSYAQSASIPCTDDKYYFFKNYNNEESNTKLLDIDRSADGNLYVSGSHGYQRYAMVAKLTKQGDTIWAKNFSQMSSTEFQVIKATKDGGFIAAGYNYRKSNGNLWLMRGDANGRQVWSVDLYDASWHKIATEILELADGSFVIAGITDNRNSGREQAAAWKVDAAGNLLWSKQLSKDFSSRAYGLVEAGNDLLISGIRTTREDYIGDDNKAMVFKIRSGDGELVWTKTYSTGSNADEFYDISQVRANEYLVTAKLSLSLTAPTSNYGYVKINGDGDVIDHATVDGQRMYYGEKASVIRPAPGGGYIGVQRFTEKDKVLFFKMEEDNTIAWSRVYYMFDAQTFHRMDLEPGGEILGVGSQINLQQGYSAVVYRLDENGTAGSCIAAPASPTVKKFASITVTNFAATFDQMAATASYASEILNAVPLTITVDCNSPSCKTLANIDSDSCSNSFLRSYGGDGFDEALDVQNTADRGNILCGRSTSGSAGNYDGFIMRTSNDGSMLWSRTIGGPGFDELRKIKLTTDNHYIAIGTSRSADNINKVWIVKTDGAGNQVWSKTFLPDNGKSSFGKDIIELADGDYAFTGVLNDSLADSDGWLAKVDRAGNIRWSTIIDEGKADGLKGLVEKNGFIYASGFITRTNKDIMLAKIDATNGSTSWLRSYRQLTNNVNEAGEECSITNGDMSFLAVYYPGNQWGVAVQQATLIYFDENGNITKESNAFFTNDYPDLAAVDIAHNDKGEMMTLETYADYTRYRSTFAKMYNEHENAWRRSINWPMHLATNAVSFLDDGSSVFVGKDASPSLKSLRPFISILKTNPRGQTGTCNISNDLDHRIFVLRVSKKTLQSGNSLTNGIATLAGVTTENTVFTNVSSPFISITFCTASDCRIAPAVQDECNSAHRTNYEADYTTTINSVVPLPDGTVLAMGYNAHKTYNRTTLKIAANGRLMSYRNLGSDTTAKLTSFTGTMPDGSLVSLGTHGQGFWNYTTIGESIALTKWDHNGNVLINKLHVFQSIDRINSFTIGSDGFIYVVGCDQSGYITPYYGIFFLKFDGNLDLVWAKHLTSGRVLPFFTASTLYKNELIVAGGLRNSGYDGFFSILKLNASTGDLVMRNTWTVGAENLIAKEVFVQNDTILLTALMNTNSTDYTSNNRAMPALLKFGMDGNFLSAFRFKGYAGLNHYHSHEIDANNAFTRTDDGKLVFATQAHNVWTAQGITTWKFDTNGKLDWGWQYPQTSGYIPNHIISQGNHIYIAGDQLTENKTQFIQVRVPFLMKLKQTGLITETAGTDCSAIAIEPGIESLNIVRDFLSREDQMTTIQPSFVYNLAEYDRLQYMKEKPACAEPALCNTLSISAPTKICSLTDTVTIFVTKEKSCHAPLIWEIGAGEAELLEANDYYAKLVFKKAGSITVTAKILVGCKIITASAIIQVSDLTKALNLGPATEICPSTTISLHAGPGFKDYLWQDGTSTDSIFVADKPGVYSVAVLDFCDRPQTASIVITAAPPVIFDLGRDTSFCLSDSITLKAPGMMTKYTWAGTDAFRQINDSTIRVSPRSDAGYSATLERSPGCVGTDRIGLSVLPLPLVNLGNDTALCMNEPLFIDAGNAGSRFLWNTGESQQVIRPLGSGTYTAIVTSPDGCKSSDAINVVFRALPVVNLGKDTAICENTSFLINANNIQSNIVWQDGSSFNSITVATPGKYWATVTDTYNCRRADSLIVTHTWKNPSNFLPDTMIICNGWNTAVKPLGAFSNYQWSTGGRQKDITVRSAGIFVLEVTDVNGCIGSDTVMISGKQCLAGVYVPNAFTPNGDGKNDQIKPLIFGEISAYHFSIFNRWGQVVFDSNDPEKGWDGRIKGLNQGNDSFIYTLTGVMKDGTSINQKGNITLVR
jgi:gliding motility-associated-like protein